MAVFDGGVVVLWSDESVFMAASWESVSLVINLRSRTSKAGRRVVGKRA